MSQGFSPPSLADIRNWLSTLEDVPKASQAARAFGIKGVEERRAFKKQYREALGRGRDSKSLSMPSTGLFEVIGTNSSGDPVSRPVQWDNSSDTPTVRIAAKKNDHRLTVGARLIARTDKDETGWVAYPIRILSMSLGHNDEVELAIVQKDGANRLELRAAKPGRPRIWKIAGKPSNDLNDGDLVLIKPVTPRLSRHGREYRAQILSTHGKADDPAAFGLALMAQMDAPINFPDEVLEEAKAAKTPKLEGRIDLRDIDLLTIDGADARDFDDAVFADKCEMGWRVIVAIADVASYVHPNTALDKEARLRGNSTYLPDRAIPMLPEALSNGLCSLKPDEDRACLYADMTFNEEGKRIKSIFGRGLMQSRFRLTYDQAFELSKSDDDSPEGIAVRRLYEAYACLKQARDARSPLELDLPERMVAFDDANRPTAMKLRTSLSSHQLIEEYMIQANAAAAEILLKKKASALYRVHDRPDPERLGVLTETALSLGASHPGARMDTTKHLNSLLGRIQDQDTKIILSELILRAQAQARYSPECDGHFGLALTAYTHFTSPIRRYADLIVHRALIVALNLGSDGHIDSEDDLEAISDQINRTERRSSLIERNTLDRYGAFLASNYLGEEFSGRIVGLNRAGLFVRISDPVLDGFIPAAQLSEDYWQLSRNGLAMESRSTKTAFHLGNTVAIRIENVDAPTGTVTFSIKNPFPSKGPSKRFNRKRNRKFKK